VVDGGGQQWMGLAVQLTGAEGGSIAGPAPAGLG